jgi:hypothetical protein
MAQKSPRGGGREYSYKVPLFAQLPGCDWAKETRRPDGQAGSADLLDLVWPSYKLE